MLMFPAEGHEAKIFHFDEKTVLMPTNADEARWLYSLLSASVKRLSEEEGENYPERARHEKLLKNLQTVMFVHDELRQGRLK